MDIVYHGSKEQGLKKIINRYQQGAYIYGSRDKNIAAIFMGEFDDFLCYIGRDKKTHKICLCERARGAFEYAFKRYSGSIYLLDSSDFVTGKTQWAEEVISEKSELTVIEEIQINNTWEYIVDRAKLGDIYLLKYPYKFSGMDPEDNDLVGKAVSYYNKFGEGILNELAVWHPELLDRIYSKITQEKLRKG